MSEMPGYWAVQHGLCLEIVGEWLWVQIETAMLGNIGKMKELHHIMSTGMRGNVC